MAKKPLNKLSIYKKLRDLRDSVVLLPGFMKINQDGPG
jgi:hypothetical protein